MTLSVGTLEAGDRGSVSFRFWGYGKPFLQCLRAGPTRKLASLTSRDSLLPRNLELS